MKKLTLILLLHLVHPASAGYSPFVENGEIVSPSDPIRLSVARLEFPSGRCTATFISRTTLLTAGHCVPAGPASATQVRVRDARGNWQTQVARDIIRHPRYRLRKLANGYRVSHDFALVKIASPMSSSVRPMRLGDPSRVVVAFPVRVLGFGKYGTGRSSQVLREGRMSATVETLPQFDGAAGLHLVAADASGHATCAGDSGGPVVLENAEGQRLVGVHSLSSGCLGDPPAESYSQMPALIRDWIEQNL